MKYLGLIIGLLSSALFSLTLYGKYFTHGEAKANVEYLMLYNDQIIRFDITVIIWPGLISSTLYCFLWLKSGGKTNERFR